MGRRRRRPSAGDRLIGYLVLIGLTIWAASAFWPVAIGVLAIGIGIALQRRRRHEGIPADRPAARPRVTIRVERSRDRPRELPPALTLASEVVPVPPPAGWPLLPDVPPGLDTSSSEAHVSVADRPYAQTTCPSCRVELDPLPKAKKRCRDCGQDIFVRSGPDNRRHLLTAADLRGFEALRVEHEQVRSIETQHEFERAEATWLDRLEAAGFAVGDEELDVVGESFYHRALAGILAALEEDTASWERRATAALVAEPNNEYDPNAVGVFINGAKVGHLDRYDAEEYQSDILRVGGRVYVQALVMGGRLTDHNKIGPIGVRLEHLPLPRELGPPVVR